MTRWRVRPVDVVLGTVPAGEREEAERLIRTEPAFRAEVERLRVVGDALAELPTDTWAPPVPPRLDRAAAFAARPPRASAGARGWRARPRARSGVAAARRRTLRPGAVLAALALFCVGGVLGAAIDGGAPGPTRATSAALAAPEGRAIVLHTLGIAGHPQALVRLPAHAGGTLELRMAGLAPSHAGQYYELWLLGDARHLAAIATFRVGPDGRVAGRFPVGVDPDSYRYVDVSVERDDGDPGHSKRSVMRSQRLT